MLCSQVPEEVLAISRAITDNTLNVAYASLHTVDFSRDALALLGHNVGRNVAQTLSCLLRPDSSGHFFRSHQTKVEMSLDPAGKGSAPRPLGNFVIQ
jgi:hypothetical protein